MIYARFFSAMVCVLAVANSAKAQNVNFTSSILDSCTLSLSVAGQMGPGGDGTSISSANGGRSAVMAVVAIGTKPTIEFAAPTLTQTPSGYSGTPLAEISYTSLGGANQEMTSTTSSYQSNLLLDTITLDAQVSDSGGFVGGNYTLTSVATCSQ